MVKLQPLCRHIHTYIQSLTFGPVAKDPITGIQSYPFARHSRRPPGGALYSYRMIYVAVSDLFFMRYHFKPTDAKKFVCEVGCGELDYSSRFQVNLTSPDSKTPDSSGVYGAHRRATRSEDVNDFPLRPAATANERKTIRSSQLMMYGSSICAILSCLPSNPQKQRS